MALFIGTHQNKLDAKGRVSIPAQFRSVLKKMSHAGEGAAVATMYLRPSHQHRCIEGWSELGFEALSAPVEEGYSLFSPEHEDFVLALFGDACVVETDKEGRIMLPPSLLAHADLGENVMFIGSRNNFQIWEPEAGARRLAEARENAKAAGFTLKTGTIPGGTMPRGAMPGGVMPGGAMPGGVMPAGALAHGVPAQGGAA